MFNIIISIIDCWFGKCCLVPPKFCTDLNQNRAKQQYNLISILGLVRIDTALSRCTARHSGKFITPFGVCENTRNGTHKRQSGTSYVTSLVFECIREVLFHQDFPLLGAPKLDQVLVL